MNILKSKLTHNEILARTGIQMTKRQLSQARMGREPALSKVKELLAGVDQEKLTTLYKDAQNIEIAQQIIDSANHLLSIPPNILVFGGVIVHNKEYLEKYKKYIDLKVEYNKLGITPRNHDELIKLHQLVRQQHEEAKNMLEVSTCI